MYIRSSPRGPNRDPNRILSNELLLYIEGYILLISFINTNLIKYYSTVTDLVRGLVKP